MESQELRDLLEFLAKSQFAEFELEREGFRLRVRKDGIAPHPAAAFVAPALVPASAPAQPGPTAAEAPPAAREENLVPVISPIVGTFYRSPSPELPPFVEVGSRVRKGQTLCIVEAMKLMNEIESEAEGEVVEIHVANGQPVEYGEVIFTIRPIG